jgi:hypothetical protein
LRHLLLGAQAACAEGKPDRLAVPNYFGLLYVGYPAVIGATLGMANVMAKLLGFSADITFHEIIPLL